MSTHKTADAASLEQKTEQFQSKLGIDPKSLAGAPRPDLNGLRLKMPNQPQVYLIDQGLRRWIPNPATYNNLFRDWSGIIVDINVDEIPQGVPITDGAILARPSNGPAVYLIDVGQKRHVTSPQVMDKYYFSWQTVYVVPHVLIDFIPTGPAIF
jgi:hypothetical protein